MSASTAHYTPTNELNEPIRDKGIAGTLQHQSPLALALTLCWFQERALMQQQRLDKLAEQDAEQDGLAPPVCVDGVTDASEELSQRQSALLRIGALVALTGTNLRSWVRAECGVEQPVGNHSQMRSPYKVG